MTLLRDGGLPRAAPRHGFHVTRRHDAPQTLPEWLPPRNRNRAFALPRPRPPWQPAPVSEAKTMPDLDSLRFRANRLLELLQSGQGGADVAQELAAVLAEIEVLAPATASPE